MKRLVVIRGVLGQSLLIDTSRGASRKRGIVGAALATSYGGSMCSRTHSHSRPPVRRWALTILTVNSKHGQTSTRGTKPTKQARIQCKCPLPQTPAGALSLEKQNEGLLQIVVPHLLGETASQTKPLTSAACQFPRKARASKLHVNAVPLLGPQVHTACQTFPVFHPAHEKLPAQPTSPAGCGLLLDGWAVAHDSSSQKLIEAKVEHGLPVESGL